MEWNASLKDLKISLFAIQSQYSKTTSLRQIER